jgi:hypothetical protein
MSCDGCTRSAIFSQYTSNAENPLYQQGFEASIRQALITDCFRFYQSYNPDSGLKPPEYLLKIDYEEKLDDSHILPDGDFLLISAVLTLSLYYNGTSEELVQTWQAIREERDYGDLLEESLPGSEQGYNYTRRRMSGRHILRKERPIELTILNDFEKQPFTCEIDPEREELYIGEEMDIEIKDIHDIEDRQSREFNRIIVQAVEGEILNGEPLENDPDLKAFIVGNGNITLQYRAPNDRNIKEDTIYVNNSCTIARVDQYPLSKTTLDKKIGEKKIKIKCDEFETSINVNLKWDQDTEDEKFTGNYNVEITGTMEFWPEYSGHEVNLYKPKDLRAKYNLESSWYLKDPPDCENRERLLLRRDESASGTVPITYVTMAPMVNHLKVQPIQSIMDESLPDMFSQLGGMLPQGLGAQIEAAMKQAGEFMSDRYELLLSTGFSPKQYKQIEKTVCKGDKAQKESEDAPIMDGFGIHIHSKMQGENRLIGSKSWNSDVIHLGSSIDINELAESIGARPLTPPRKQDGFCTYSVNWNLKRKNQ